MVSSFFGKTFRLKNRRVQIIMNGIKSENVYHQKDLMRRTMK